MYISDHFFVQFKVSFFSNLSFRLWSHYYCYSSSCSSYYYSVVLIIVLSVVKSLIMICFHLYYYHIYWFVSTIIVWYFSSCPHLLLFPIFISVMTIATTIAFIVIFMNFSILLFSCVVVLFYFRLNNFFSDMKGLRLVNYVVSLFVPLFVYLIYLSSWSRRVKIHNLTTFPPVPKKYTV